MREAFRQAYGTVTVNVTVELAASLTVMVDTPVATAVTLKVSPVSADTVAAAVLLLVTWYVGAGLNFTPPEIVIERDCPATSVKGPPAVVSNVAAGPQAAEVSWLIVMTELPEAPSASITVIVTALLAVVMQRLPWLPRPIVTVEPDTVALARD